MTIISISGWEAKGFTTTGGAVSPSLRQKETIKNFNCLLYNEYLLWEVEEDFILCG